jgi:hypothetical protein
VTFLRHLFGVPPATHTNSVPAESMDISPLAWAPTGLPARLVGTSINCAQLPANFPPYLLSRPSTPGQANEHTRISKPRVV